MGSQISGSDQPTGVNSPSQANAALADRLSTVTCRSGSALRVARNSAAASNAAATAPVARPVTSKYPGSTTAGPVASKPESSPGSPPATRQVRALTSLNSPVTTIIVP